MLKYIVTIFSFLLIWSLAVDNFAIRAEIGDRLLEATSDEEVVEILKEYLEKIDDMTVIRDIQDTWMEIDEERSRDYFTRRYEQDPNKDNRYLWARYIDDTFKRLQEARKLIEQYPEYYYGYLLLSFPYNQYLFPDEPEDDMEFNLEKLEEEFGKDRQHLYRWLYLFPEDEFSLYTIYNMKMWKDNYELAEQFLLNTEGMNAQWVNYFSIMDFSIKSERLQPFKTFLPKFMHTNIEQGHITREDSLTTYANYYLMLLRTIGHYDEIDNFLAQHPDLYDEVSIKRRLVSTNLDQGNYEKAFLYLNQLLDAGNVDYLSIDNEEQWFPLKEHPLWKDFIVKAKQRWDEAKPQRKKEALAQKTERPAPGWELKDLNDNITRLSEYRSQPIIKLFWATWSDDSVEMMKALDEWVKNNNPEKITVLAISLAEPYPEVVQRHINAQGYSDKIRFIRGVDNIPSMYSFQELPFIIVIDTNGNIRYEQQGLSQNIKEKLTWWVEEVMDD